MKNMMWLRRMRPFPRALEATASFAQPMNQSVGIHQRVTLQEWRPAQQRATGSLQWALSGAALLGLAGVTAMADDTNINGSNSLSWNCTQAEPAKDEPIEYDQVVEMLRNGISTFRGDLKKSHRIPKSIPIPKLNISRCPAPNGVSTIRIEFGCPDFVDRDVILAAFLKKLEKAGSSIKQTSIEVLPVQNPNTSADFASVQYIYADGTGSFHFLQKPEFDRRVSQFDGSFVFYKDEALMPQEVDAVLSAYKALFSETNVARFRRPDHMPRLGSAGDGFSIQFGPGMGMEDGTARGPPENKEMAIKALEKLGIDVFHPENSDNSLNWDSLAGYEKTKLEIEDTIVLALQNPELYEEIARKTRCRYESNRPRAVLFEGPPGTGKTLTARIIAQEAGVPMIHVPIESVVSKWYGDSEKKMSSIFDAVEKLDGAIIFIDEIDALAGSRSDHNMHEASRRILSVLLQKVEGFASAKKTTVICATNRKQDLDMALISRFDLCIRYDLPDEATRTAVFHRYAKQLSSKDLDQLATVSAGLSCRDIKEVCEYAERKWASKLLKKEVSDDLPPIESYLEALRVHVTGVGHSDSNHFDESVEA